MRENCFKKIVGMENKLLEENSYKNNLTDRLKSILGKYLGTTFLASSLLLAPAAETKGKEGLSKPKVSYNFEMERLGNSSYSQSYGLWPCEEIRWSLTPKLESYLYLIKSGNKVKSPEGLLSVDCRVDYSSSPARIVVTASYLNTKTEFKEQKEVSGNISGTVNDDAKYLDHLAQELSGKLMLTFARSMEDSDPTTLEKLFLEGAPATTGFNIELGTAIGTNNEVAYSVAPTLGIGYRQCLTPKICVDFGFGYELYFTNSFTALSS